MLGATHGRLPVGLLAKQHFSSSGRDQKASRDTNLSSIKASSIEPNHVRDYFIVMDGRITCAEV